MDNRGSLTPHAASPAGIYSIINSPPPLPPKNNASWEGLVSYLGDNQLLAFDWLVNPSSSIEQYQRVGCIADGNCLFHAVLKALYPLYEQSYYKRNQITEEQLQQYEKGLYPEAVKHISHSKYIFTGAPYNITHRSTNPNQIYTIHHQHLYENQMDNWRRAYTISFRWDFANRILSDAQIQGLIFRYLSGSVDLYVDMYKHQGHSNDKSIVMAQQKLLQHMYNELMTLSDVPPDYLLILAEYAGVDFYLLRYSDLYQNVCSPLYGGDTLHRSVRGHSQKRPSIVVLSVNNNHYELIGKTVGYEVNIIYRFDSQEPLITRLFNILQNLRNGLSINQCLTT